MCLWVVLGCVCALPAIGASPSSKTGRVSRLSFAHMVPPEVEFFVEMEFSSRTKRYTERSRFWELLDTLPGAHRAQLGVALDWDSFVERHLGMSPKQVWEDLLGERAALAAPSWQQLDRAVIIVRMKDERALDPVVREERIEHGAKMGPMGVYRTKAGLWVATNGRHAAFCQDGDEKDSLFWKVIQRLNTGQGRSLADERDFRFHAGRLRNDTMGLLYARGTRPDGLLASLAPGATCIALGAVVLPDRIFFELRASLDKPRQRLLDRIDVPCLQRLPNTVLMAWAMPVDAAKAYQAVKEASPDAPSAAYVSLLRAAVGEDVLENQIIGKLGRRAVLVWDRVRSSGSMPQMSVLMQTREAPAVAAALAQLANALAHPLDRAQQESHVERIDFLDSVLWTVPLDGLLDSGPQKTLAAELLASIQPTFTSLDGWVVASSSPAAARQLVEADRGLIPQLESVRGLGVRSIRRPEHRTVLALAQPAMASAVLAHWRAGDDPSSSRLDQMVGSVNLQVGRVHRPLLGIAIASGEYLGTARVVRVEPDKSAAGKLEVDDEIVGVNGAFLDLKDPVGDLRSKVQEATGPNPLTLRVWRGDSLLDVEIPLPAAPQARRLAPQVSILEALDQLQALGRLVSYATYSIDASSPDWLHAKLSLQFAPHPDSSPQTAGTAP